MKWIVDRIEKNIAVNETPCGMISVALEQLPSGTNEGDVITLNIDICERGRREKIIETKMKRLFGDK